MHILWMNGGLSCDGDSVALTAATQPSIEEIALGALPGLPKIAVHWPLIDFECGPVGGADDFLEWFFKADRGELEPFVLVIEGSIPNEAIKQEGYWCGFGNNPETGQPMTTSEWIDRLAPKALAVLAVGTCATYGGICIGFTMPGFPDKVMPFMDEPPGSKVSTAASGMYGTVIRTLRNVTAKTVDKEPKWRKTGRELTTGYRPNW